MINWLSGHVWICTYVIAGLAFLTFILNFIIKRYKRNASLSGSYKNRLEANEIENSSINQANRDVNINYQGLSVPDVIDIVNAALTPGLNANLNKTETEIKGRLKKFSEDLVTQINNNVADKLERFNEPAIRFAVREAALGYVKTGSLSDEVNLIDLMLERVKVEENTTKQKLIDQAISIIPTLSRECLALVSILALKKIYYTGFKTDFDNWFISLNPIIDSVPNDISYLDVGYLQQAGCTYGIVGVTSSEDYIDFLLKECDFSFRHPVPETITEKFKKKYGLKYDANGHLVSYHTQSGPFESFLVNYLGLGVDVKGVIVNWSSLKGIKDILNRNKLDYLVNDVQEMYDSSVLFSRDEVKSYLKSLNPRWSYVLDLFSRKDIKSYTLTAVGYYIASRVLTNEGNDITVELFYSSL